jgi:hypothetical protein
MDEDIKKLKGKRHLRKGTQKIREQKVIEGVLVENKTLRQAGIDAGYAPASAQQMANLIMKKPEAKKAFAAILEEKGLTDEILADKLSKLIHAKKKVFAQKDGVFTDEREVDDNECQRKSVVDLLGVKGHIKPSPETQINILANAMTLVVDTLAKAGEE